MSLSFLPENLKLAVSNLNYNFLSEIRIRKGQPVIIEYRGEYKYINSYGIAENGNGLIFDGELEPIINAATGGSIYNFVEQMKNGFITVGHGIRIGIAGEYVTQNGLVQTIRNITSLNIRIPHDVKGCAEYILDNLFTEGLHGVLIFSKPGLGKTTMLRDIAVGLSKKGLNNILVYDERNEISAMDGFGNGFNLGDRVDVIRCNSKKGAILSAIRAMKPQLIITDELYGKEDIDAVRYAAECGICVIASTHICDRKVLKLLPFEFYAELTGLGIPPVIYDKNFNTYCRGGVDNFDRNISVGK